MAAAEVGEDKDGELNLGTALLLAPIGEDVIIRDDVATRGIVATLVVGVVANSVPGTEGANVVSPGDESTPQYSREMPLLQQPKVVQ